MHEARPEGLLDERDAEASRHELILREISHRCKNDLQLVVGMLALQLRRTSNAEAREALGDALARVEVLTRSRTFFQDQEQVSLDAALRQVCEALQAHAEVREIIVTLQVGASRHELEPSVVTAVAMAVNELAINAIKHAFADERPGKITVSVKDHDGRHVGIVVDDDGLPFPELEQVRRTTSGWGLDLVSRLVASVGGVIFPPAKGRKAFEIRVPAKQIE